MDEADRARQEVIDALAEVTGRYEIDAAVGRVYGHLYFADEPLTPADVDADSELTAGEVADALATLERVRDLEELYSTMDALVDLLERVPLGTVMDLLEKHVNGECPRPPSTRSRTDDGLELQRHIADQSRLRRPATLIGRDERGWRSRTSRNLSLPHGDSIVGPVTVWNPAPTERT